MIELDRIFDENGMGGLYDIDLGGIHFRGTGNSVEFSDNEIQSRFEDAYECILSGLNKIRNIQIKVVYCGIINQLK